MMAIERHQVETKGMSQQFELRVPFMDKNPFYSGSDIDVQPKKEKVNRW